MNIASCHLEKSNERKEIGNQLWLVLIFILNFKVKVFCINLFWISSWIYDWLTDDKTNAHGDNGISSNQSLTLKSREFKTIYPRI